MKKVGENQGTVRWDGEMYEKCKVDMKSVDNRTEMFEQGKKWRERESD